MMSKSPKKSNMTENSLFVNFRNANNEISRFISDIDSSIPLLPPIGNDLAQRSADSCVAGIVVSRIRKKFAKPSPKNKQILDENCFSLWKENEESIMCRSSKNGFYDRNLIAKMRSWLNHKLNGFHIDWKKVDVTIPPGETFISSQGRTCAVFKFTDPNHWTYTSEVLVDSVELCFNHYGMNHALDQLFKASKHVLTDEILDKLVAISKGLRQYEDSLDAFINKPLSKVITAYKFVCVATEVNGSRATTVAKDNDARRLIEVQPLFNVILQFTVGQELRKLLKRNCFINLETGQDLHARLSTNFDLCTIDSSSASDLISLYVLKQVLPDHIYKYIKRFRTQFTLIQTDYYYTYKVSAMGNGFTFELLTLMTACIGALSSTEYTAYGDDLIILDEAYEQCVQYMKSFGFKINEAKSFKHTDNIRESCGAFAVRGYGLVPCYSIEWIASVGDYIVTCNKIKLIADELKVIGPHTQIVKERLQELWECLSSLSPARLKGPVPHYRGHNYNLVSFDHYVWHPNWKRSLSSIDDNSYHTIKGGSKKGTSNFFLRLGVYLYYYNTAPDGSRLPLGDVLIGSLFRKKQVYMVEASKDIDIVRALLSCRSGKIEKTFLRGEFINQTLQVCHLGDGSSVSMKVCREYRSLLLKHLVIAQCVLKASLD